MLIKRWPEAEFPFWGETLRLRLKALNTVESPDFLKNLDAVAGKKEVFGAFNQPWVKEAFENYVRPAEPIDLDEGEKIESGAQLYEVATPGLIMAVLLKLQEFTVLTEEQGKDSPSPSTSDSETTPAPDASG